MFSFFFRTGLLAFFSFLFVCLLACFLPACLIACLHISGLLPGVLAFFLKFLIVLLAFLAKIQGKVHAPQVLLACLLVCLLVCFLCFALPCLALHCIALLCFDLRCFACLCQRISNLWIDVRCQPRAKSRKRQRNDHVNVACASQCRQPSSLALTHTCGGYTAQRVQASPQCCVVHRVGVLRTWPIDSCSHKGFGGIRNLLWPFGCVFVRLLFWCARWSVFCSKMCACLCVRGVAFVPVCVCQFDCARLGKDVRKMCFFTLSAVFQLRLKHVEASFRTWRSRGSVPVLQHL